MLEELASTMPTYEEKEMLDHPGPNKFAPRQVPMVQKLENIENLRYTPYIISDPDDPNKEVWFKQDH